MASSCICADPNAVLFIESVFRECRVGSEDISIFVIQYISIIIWIFALLPQIRLSFLAKISDVSIFFSIIWTFADTLSLISMFLTNVMISQKIMQIYFVVVDVILFLQVIYYKRHQNIPKLSLEVRPAEYSTYILIVVCVIVGIAMYYWQNSDVIRMIKEDLGTITENLNCNEQGEGNNEKVVLAGNIIGYISIPFFPLSRITQIVKNARSKHVDGISPLMFCLTVAGNVTQFISLIIDAIAYNRFVDQLPFMCNAILPALLDVVILIQYYILRNQEQKSQDQETLQNMQQVRVKRQLSIRENIMQSIDLSDYQEQVGNNKATQTENEVQSEAVSRAEPAVLQELNIASEQKSEEIEKCDTQILDGSQK